MESRLQPVRAILHLLSSLITASPRCWSSLALFGAVWCKKNLFFLVFEDENRVKS